MGKWNQNQGWDLNPGALIAKLLSDTPASQ